MWDDAKALNAAAWTLAILAVMAIAGGALSWLVRQPVFAFRAVEVTTPLVHASAPHVEAVIREELAGTFFTLNLDRARAALAKVPWVRSVALRRQWPPRLEVEIDEHVPLARWNDDALVDQQGEVFAADYAGDLPQFAGPEGRASEVADRFREWSGTLAPLALTLHEVALSARDGWSLRASGAAGPLTIELGREEPDARLVRLVDAYGRTLGALARAGTPVAYVDLRYRNGFAARIPGFKEKPARKT
jgi:cell division protein FtsQ